MLFNPLKIKHSTNGMLSIEAYQAIYDFAHKTLDGTILEVGTAHGAATISLALGIKDKGNTCQVISIDKITGGSRDRYGTLEENRAIIEKNFNKFDVQNNIHFYIGDTVEIAPKLPHNIKISLLMLDADGAIDRDFELFYNKIVPGGTIIIDDYVDQIRLKKKKRYILIDQKHRLTHRLVSFMEKEGLIEKVKIVDDTYFGRKPLSQISNIDFKQYDFRPIYRELIFARGSTTGRFLQLKSAFIHRISKLTASCPTLHTLLRKTYKRFNF